MLPKVTYKDIVYYFIVNPSPFTAEELRAYKGLDAYNQFVNGWVSDVLSLKINDVIVVKAKVM